ncbi:dipicolinate synthase subunit A [Orenia metallireducens]|uniref:Dipicolinate synthase subunit A n=1 Tax=Orenia metallireducens TaxID=1413210 RepID=A0A285FKU3_9FIRM|nr:dipicolinate synthase subunit DpsA [Orenia metallireducens]PRX33600.1 dipicolinate synthase subunit A [Orenia metallireducens]SNY11703.1 dipicolinate synthase subunit A [Orenia metallireducens]
MNTETLVNQKIALLGGDDREIELISILLDQEAALQIIGQPPGIDSESIEVVASLEEIDDDVIAVIAPMTGTDEKLQVKKTFTNKEVILTEEFFSSLKAGTKFFIGFAKPEIKDWTHKHGIELTELAALDEVAILNAIPTAEGAIEIAMGEMPITLHSNNSFVLGLGRVGFSLARMLKGMGSKVYGVARKHKDFARALDMGFEQVAFKDLEQEISKADFIFNTVPVLILDEELLQHVKKDAIIIDLASYPGGTDFEAAKRLGLKAELALGLPGKVAPKSAGQILGKVIPRIILNEG